MSARILDFVVAKLVSSRAIVSYSLSQSGLGSCSAHIRTHQSLAHTHTHAHTGISHVLCVLFYASSRLRHRMRASLMTILLTVPPSLSLSPLQLCIDRQSRVATFLMHEYANLPVTVSLSHEMQNYSKTHVKNHDVFEWHCY